MTTLRVKNWDSFQHYKDRDPPWIKLHRGLIDDYAFWNLSDETKGHLVLIWLLAARCGNRVPNDKTWLQGRIGAKKPIDLAAIIAAGFLEEAPVEKEASRADGWGSRYVSAQLKTEVLRRGNGVCAECGSAENIEIDHIVPVSRGGKADIDNLQPLCRRCNRRKRAKLGGELRRSAEQVATQTNDSAYSRGRGETETETETEGDQSSPRPLERSAGTPVADLDFKCDGQPALWSVTSDLIADWSKAFPSLDVTGECRKAKAWVSAKSERRKTARGMKAFLVGWFGRSQNSGRTGGSISAVDKKFNDHQQVFQEGRAWAAGGDK